MNNLPYDVIAASKPFRFLVGPDKKEFMMHAELVANLSKPLMILASGKMKEAKEGIAELPEVDEETFVRFFQFAYTGNYTSTALLHSLRSFPTVESKQEVDSNLDDFFGGFGMSKKDKKKKKSLYMPVQEPRLQPEPEPETQPEPEPQPGYPFFDKAWRRFKETTFPLSEKRQAPADSSPAVPKLHADPLLHAKIYVLADYYDIERLTTLSLEKLHQALVDLTLAKDRITAVVELLEYCFSNTVDKGSSKDRLRTLVTSYVATKLDTLWGSEYFQEALERSGELSKTIIGEVLKGLT